jgi:hypothetical protein
VVGLGRERGIRGAEVRGQRVYDRWRSEVGSEGNFASGETSVKCWKSEKGKPEDRTQKTEASLRRSDAVGAMARQGGLRPDRSGVWCPGRTGDQQAAGTCQPE